MLDRAYQSRYSTTQRNFDCPRLPSLFFIELSLDVLFGLKVLLVVVESEVAEQ